MIGENEEITTKHGRFRVRVEYDGAAESPREWANLGVLTLARTREFVGVQEDSDPQRTDRILAAVDRGVSPRAIGRWLRSRHGATDVMPVMRCHDGDVLPVTEDARLFHGFIYDTPETRAECGEPAGGMRGALEAELSLYNRWGRGEFVGWIAERFIPACEHGHGDEWDQVCSVWSIDDPEYAMTEAREFVASYDPAVGV